MPKSHRILVKRRLILINAAIVITSVIGIFSIVEVTRGVGFHESNIRHLGFTSELKQKIAQFDTGSNAHLTEIRDLLTEMRKEPDACLASRNWFHEFGMKAMGTSDVYRICQYDTDIIGKALAMIPEYQAGKISETEFISQFKKYSHIMHNHSFEFRPLISQTVDILLMITALIIFLKGCAVAVISIFSSRSIMRQFQHVMNMESALRQKNLELEDSVTELQKQKVKIAQARQLAEFNARHDTLTGLPNRRYLDTKLAAIKQRNESYAIFHIDIDGFKQINDTRGHSAGDYVLTQIARRLESIGDEVELVARVGGDEFVLVTVFQQSPASDLPEPLASAQWETKQQGVKHPPAESCAIQLQIAEQVAQKVVTLLNKPVFYEEFNCRISASVGIAIGSTEDCSASSSAEILVDADLAMYHQKTRGKNGYTFYDQSLRQSMIEKKLLADEIHAALEACEFVPFYQAQVESETFKITGVEALARWQHPTRGLLTPDEFLAVATDMGVLGDLDRMIFEKAYQNFTEWDEMQLDVQGLSVNMSLNRLMDPMLMRELEKYDLTHNRVSFELVESVLFDGCDDEMQAVINRLNELGIQLELDDFGSGHASVIGLLALNPNRFKIDRQLINSICTSSEQRALIRSIIDIGKSVNVEVVAEGIETLDQALLLRELGCNYLQGYYFSKPINNDEFISLVSEPSYAKAA